MTVASISFLFHRREVAVRELLSRHCHSNGTAKKFSEKEALLVESMKVPAKWIFEAKVLANFNLEIQMHSQLVTVKSRLLRNSFHIDSLIVFLCQDILLQNRVCKPWYKKHFHTHNSSHSTLGLKLTFLFLEN